MAPTVAPDELTPLARLQLREALQDLWRDQVRRITLLSLSMYDDLDAAEPTALTAPGATPGAVDAALAEARALLAELEAAMRRLDEGQYGRCLQCGSTIGYDQLTSDPLATRCSTHPRGLEDR